MHLIKTKREVILESLRKINKIQDIFLIAETTKEALKKSRLTKEKTPEHLAKVFKVTFINVSVGNNYEFEVNKQRELEGKEGDFKAQGTYCIPLTTLPTSILDKGLMLLKQIGFKIDEKLSKIIYKHNTKEQYYVRIYPTLAKEYNCQNYYFDSLGNEIPSEKFDQIEAEYLPLKSENKNQELEKTIWVNNYKLENVIYLGNEKSNPINELTEEVLALRKIA